MAHKFKGLVKSLGVNLEACTSAPEHALGTVVEGVDAAGRAARYRYVRFLDAVTYLAGHVVTIASATTWAVSNDRDGGSALAGLMPVGVVFQETPPTQNQYGWVQISGIATIIAGSASIAAGDYLKPDASEDGDTDEATAGTDENIVGVALAAIGDNASGLCMLTIRGS